MKAAVVTSFGRAPRYEDFADPIASDTHERVAAVLAAGLSPRVRAQANGSHYTSTGDLPLIPGIDGVGRTDDGELRYFVLPDTTLGAMAERTVIDLRRSVALPEGADPIQLAAAMNPAMSSWIALRRRAEFEPGQSVLILGATGSAGRLAIEVAARLGAGRVVAVGRGVDRMAELRALGADATVALDGESRVVAAELAEAGKDVDVVLDYLWGRPTAEAMYAIIPRRTRDAQRLAWVQIGSVAGIEAPIPSAALRAANLQIVGSGQGSVSPRDILAELPALAAEIAEGSFAVNATAVPLSQVEEVWTAPASGDRIVFVP